MPISLPQKIKSKKIGDFQEEIIIGPCFPGYGITLGNALKRVLLSSLPGGAVYAVKIKGVPHEFSTIPNVLEDVVEIILNLKQLRFKLHGNKKEEGVKLLLEVKGEKEVKAKDIKLTSDVELITPDVHLATLTDKNAELKMEIFVKEGRGFWPVEDREEEKEIGVIAIDSYFSPIKKVGLDIENARVGQMTTYENIILNITTDGSLLPREALKEAAKILTEQFQYVEKNALGEEEEEKAEAKEDKAEKKEKSEEKSEKKEEKKKKTTK